MSGVTRSAVGKLVGLAVLAGAAPGGAGSQPYRHVRATVRGYWREFAGSNLRPSPCKPFSGSSAISHQPQLSRSFGTI